MCVCVCVCVCVCERVCGNVCACILVCGLSWFTGKVSDVQVRCTGEVIGVQVMLLVYR